MIDRDWDPGSQRKIGDRGDLWLGGRESKSNSSIGDLDFDSLAITLRGDPQAFHRLGRRIAVVRKSLLLGSFIWMQYPEDQSYELQGMGFGIIERSSFASILESGNLSSRLHHFLGGKIWRHLDFKGIFLRGLGVFNLTYGGWCVKDIRFLQEKQKLFSNILKISLNVLKGDIFYFLRMSILFEGKGMRGMNVGVDNCMLSRTQCIFHRLARSCRWVRAYGVERNQEREGWDARSHGNGWFLQIQIPNECWVIGFEVLFGAWRLALGIAILALCLFPSRNKDIRCLDSRLSKYWVKLTVKNYVFLVCIYIGLWDYDIVGGTFGRSCYYMVWICDWGYLYMDREFLYFMDMLCVLVLRQLVIRSFLLLFQIVIYMVFGKIMNYKRRLEFGNLCLFRYFPNILLAHRIYKWFLWRLQGIFLREGVETVLLSWGLEILGSHYTQFSQLSRGFLYFFK